MKIFPKKYIIFSKYNFGRWEDIKEIPTCSEQILKTKKMTN